jgi:hypothetical protein
VAPNERYRGTLSEDDKLTSLCHAFVEDGVLWLNLTGFVVFVNRLQGKLAKALQLRGSFFDAFADVGSQQAKAFLEAKLRRAAADPAAAELRAGIDGPATALMTQGSIHELAAALQGALVGAMQGVIEQCVRREVRAALPVVLDVAQLAPEAVQVNINAPSRSNADLRRINLVPPETAEEEAELVDGTLLVTKYLRQKFAHEDLSPLVRERAVQSFRSFFSTLLKTRKAAATAPDNMPMAGQIGRAQVHYRHADRPLMDQVWEAAAEHRALLVKKLEADVNSAATQIAARVARLARSRSPRVAA